MKRREVFSESPHRPARQLEEITTSDYLHKELAVDEIAREGGHSLGEARHIFAQHGQTLRRTPRRVLKASGTQHTFKAVATPGGFPSSPAPQGDQLERFLQVPGSKLGPADPGATGPSSNKLSLAQVDQRDAAYAVVRRLFPRSLTVQEAAWVAEKIAGIDRRAELLERVPALSDILLDRGTSMKIRSAIALVLKNLETDTDGQWIDNYTSASDQDPTAPYKNPL